MHLHTIRWQFFVDIANLPTLHTPQWNNRNKYKGINPKANKQAFQ